MIKVLITIGNGSAMEFFVQFASKKQSATLSRKRKGSSDDRDSARPDESGGTAFSRLKRSLSLRRSSSSAGTANNEAYGMNYFALFVLSYLSRDSIESLLFPEFMF